MVILAITTLGLEQALALPPASVAVWCSSDAITEADFRVRIAKHSFTRFSYSLYEVSAETLARALAMIGEHHPGEAIFVEGTPPA